MKLAQSVNNKDVSTSRNTGHKSLNMYFVILTIPFLHCILLPLFAFPIFIRVSSCEDYEEKEEASYLYILPI